MMKRVPIAIVLLLALLARPVLAAELPTAKPEQVGLSSERLDRIGNRGVLDGARVLAQKTVGLMTADHLGLIARGTRYYAGPGYTWGLGLAVHEQAGISPMAGSAGDDFWPGAYATYWWADPKEELVVVSMMQSPLGGYYQQVLRALVSQAIAE